MVFGQKLELTTIVAVCALEKPLRPSSCLTAVLVRPNHYTIRVGLKCELQIWPMIKKYSFTKLIDSLYDGTDISGCKI